ncbi:MAG: hypothetical protein CBD97_01465 [Pelagibacteraceae bacterium TMED237]|nr:hypothetical protein [Candidatus Neomarinimicrobiota bacterium]OUW96296.1 MAG: hypothetical protein CBD97_01465 [Pelagibacteraceae bacterium TMED237]
MKVLIIHGPNMNLLGKHSQARLTLDKLNRSIRRFSREQSIQIKIFQTHDEAKVVTLLQRNRNKVDGVIISLGSWHPYAYTLLDTLKLINLPYRVVENKIIAKQYIEKTIFKLKNIIQNEDFEKAYIQGIKQVLNQ